MKEIVKNEIMKWLDVGIRSLIYNNQWVGPI